jgi:hypothetical protein
MNQSKIVVGILKRVANSAHGEMHPMTWAPRSLLILVLFATSVTQSNSQGIPISCGSLVTGSLPGFLGYVTNGQTLYQIPGETNYTFTANAGNFVAVGFSSSMPLLTNVFANRLLKNRVIFV